MPHLQDLSGLLMRSSELTDRPTFIGRDPTVCDVCFPDDTTAVSRIHASVRWDEHLEKCVLRDEGSMNGTYLEGARSALVEGEDVAIDVGQTFYLGRSELALRIVR